MTRFITQKPDDTLAVSAAEKVHEHLWRQLRLALKDIEKHAVHSSQQPGIFGVFDRRASVSNSRGTVRSPALNALECISGCGTGCTRKQTNTHISGRFVMLSLGRYCGSQTHGKHALLGAQHRERGGAKHEAALYAALAASCESHELVLAGTLIAADCR
jgi:hypothetical protein